MKTYHDHILGSILKTPLLGYVQDPGWVRLGKNRWRVPRYYREEDVCWEMRL